jgi:hypothetical protein
MENVISVVLQTLLEYFLPVLAVALVGLIIAKIKLAIIQMRSWNPKVTDLLEQAVKFAVTAAEQAGAAELIKDKKVYAFEIAERWLELRGIKIDLDLIDAAIESAVYEQFNYDKTYGIGFDPNEGNVS